MLQLIGLWMAAVAFVSIWWGHVGVRWLERVSPNIWPPIVVLGLSAMAMNIAALLSNSLWISSACSVVGFSLFWDAIEVYRQQWRIIHGHAPANPDNPRHAAYLAANMGHRDDPLKREPTGQPVDALHLAPRCQPCTATPCLTCPRRKANQKFTRRQEAHAAIIAQLAEVEQ